MIYARAAPSIHPWSKTGQYVTFWVMFAPQWHQINLLDKYGLHGMISINLLCPCVAFSYKLRKLNVVMFVVSNKIKYPALVLDFVTKNKHHNKNFGPNLCFQSNLISSKFASFGRKRKRKIANFFNLAKLGKKYPWLETQTINPAEPGNQ